jgi:hypothetical protein
MNIIKYPFFKNFCDNYEYNHKYLSMTTTLILGFYVSQLVKVTISSNFIYQSIDIFYGNLVTMLMYSFVTFYSGDLLNNSIEHKYSFDSLIYQVPMISGIVCFSYMDQVKYLSDIVLVGNFWKKLSYNSQLILYCLTFVIFCFIVNNCRIYYREYSLYKYINQPLFVTIMYLLIYFLIIIENSGTILHLHHAFAAIYLSLFFRNWRNIYDVVMHALCVGIWIQGFNFYGIDELYIFVLTNIDNDVSQLYSTIAIVIIYFITIILGFIFRNNYISN